MNVSSNFDQNILTWNLFLDRDGVINKKIENDYVRKWEDFKFISGSLEAIVAFNNLFNKIIIVTNQRGVAKGYMSIFQLNEIHNKFQSKVEALAGRIDKIYYCTDISDNSPNRKPNIGMGILAKSEFPEIDFSRSIMVGDSITDMEFGKRLGMKTVFIGIDNENFELIDIFENTLFDFYINFKCGYYNEILK